MVGRVQVVVSAIHPSGGFACCCPRCSVTVPWVTVAAMMSGNGAPMRGTGAQARLITNTRKCACMQQLGVRGGLGLLNDAHLRETGVHARRIPRQI